MVKQKDVTREEQESPGCQRTRTICSETVGGLDSNGGERTDTPTSAAPSTRDRQVFAGGCFGGRSGGLLRGYPRSASQFPRSLSRYLSLGPADPRGPACSPETGRADSHRASRRDAGR